MAGPTTLGGSQPPIQDEDVEVREQDLIIVPTRAARHPNTVSDKPAAGAVLDRRPPHPARTNTNVSGWDPNTILDSEGRAWRIVCP